MKNINVFNPTFYQQYNNKIYSVVSMHPSDIIVSDDIKNLCYKPYKKIDGRCDLCGGVKSNRSACPPYSPKVEDTLKVLKNSNAFIVFLAIGLESFIDQLKLHSSLLKLETEFSKTNIINASYSCGPCRMCNVCLGNGDCNLPEKRRFSLESCGIDVVDLTDKIFNSTNIHEWKLNWISNYENYKSVDELLKQKKFKSVMALAVV